MIETTNVSESNLSSINVASIWRQENDLSRSLKMNGAAEIDNDCSLPISAAHYSHKLGESIK